MLQSIKDIHGFKINAFDGVMGKVDEFLFNIETREVQFVVIDMGSFLNSGLYLVNANALGTPDMEKKLLPVYLTLDEIVKNPFSKPSGKINDKYAWPYYWVGTGGGFPITTPNAAHGFVSLKTLNSTFEPEKMNQPNSISSREILKYKIKGFGKETAYVDDLLLDDKTWKMSCIVAGLGNRLLSRRKLLITMNSLQNVDIMNESVTLDLSAPEVSVSPEFISHQKMKRAKDKDIYNNFNHKVGSLIFNNR